MGRIGVIGVGRLGICLALNLERAGFDVFCVDVDVNRVNQIQFKEGGSIEPDVDKYLSEAQHIHASNDLHTLSGCNTIFICVATPSTAEGAFDHININQVMKDLAEIHFENDRVDVVISSTVMPGFVNSLQNVYSNSPLVISYNPEFIAQGSILHDQQFPDQLLIGEADHFAGDKILAIRKKVVKNEPVVNRMKPHEAEITKLAVNCFLTTKIAFANSVGDLTKGLNGNEMVVLKAIGSDRRIGNLFLKYGFGFGGPCLPRDNRALNYAANRIGISMPISEATDIANKKHLDFQIEEFEKEHSTDEIIEINQISYKPDSDILEESQQLAFALRLTNDGYAVRIVERKEVIDQLQKLYGDRFIYQERS